MARKLFRAFAAAALVCASATVMAGAGLAAEKKYDQGASDTEIKLGQTMPYSGPLSAHGIQGRTEVAYFRKLNEEQGGINGRKVNLISLDDAFSPPKTVEQTRKLVEQDGVLALFGSSGTAAQSAVQKYLNSKKIPQLLVSTGANKWNQPKEFPWSSPAFFLYGTEGEVFGRYVAKTKPEGKIAILYQNDDFGKDYVSGFKKGLGDKAKNIIKEVTYELTDPTMDSQVLAAKNSGADVFFNVSLGKATPQIFKKVHELNWKPMHLVVSPSTGRVFLEAAGLDTVQDIIGATAYKQMTSPRWAKDPDVIGYQEFLAKYLPNEDKTNEIGFVTYSFAHVMAHILREAGDNLTRENIMRVATNLKNVKAPALLPGSTYNTTPTDFVPFKRLELQQFKGNDWVVLEEMTAD